MEAIESLPKINEEMAAPGTEPGTPSIPAAENGHKLREEHLEDDGIDPAVEAAMKRVFASPESVIKALESVGYLTNPQMAYAAFFAARIDYPILLEGPAGAGKTQLALSLCQATGMKMVRLQCYEGISNKEAIGDFSPALRELYAQTRKDQGKSFAEQRHTFVTMAPEFFVAGPLLQAITSKQRCLLLIDEIDKVPKAFEAVLLELLNDWQLSIPGISGSISATTRPLTILTSNAERVIADALRRRCTFIEIKHPTPVLEAKIVALSTPSLPVETHKFIAGLTEALHSCSIAMKKRPAISELRKLALALELLGLRTLREEDCEIILPLFAKHKEDVKKLRLRGNFGMLVKQAAIEAQKLDINASGFELEEEEKK